MQVLLPCKVCRITTDAVPGKIVQSEIDRNGASILINIRGIDGTLIHNGDDLFVVQLDIKRIDGIKNAKDRDLISHKLIV